MVSQLDTEESPPKCDFSADDLLVSEELLADQNLNSWECSRPVWEQVDEHRCVWHAAVDDKSKTELMKSKGDGDLHGAILYDTDLKKADLGERDLDETGVDLTGADLRDADLTGADLRQADLTEARLRYATLTEAILGKADLTRADLCNANLTNADLYDADLTGSNPGEANLTGVNLCDADLTRANLEETDLTKTDLNSDPFSDAKLEGADLSNANLFGLTLTNADLSRATLTEADLRRTNLQNAELSFTNACEAYFTSADCENTQFDKANLNRATLVNADLSGADFSQAYLYQTRFDGGRISNQTQFCQEGEIGNSSTVNACRYDSDIPPDSPTACLTDQVASDTDPEEARARRARSTYSRLEALSRENGFPELKSEMFIRRQDARRELLAAQDKRIKSSFAWVQKLLFNYGESFFRVAAVSAAIVIGSWLWFLFSGTVETAGGERVTYNAATNDPLLIWETFYYTISVFFTGQGLLEARGVAGQLSIAGLRVSGPILLALLVFVLGRRAAR